MGSVMCERRRAVKALSARIGAVSWSRHGTAGHAAVQLVTPRYSWSHHARTQHREPAVARCACFVVVVVVVSVAQDGVDGRLRVAACRVALFGKQPERGALAGARLLACRGGGRAADRHELPRHLRLANAPSHRSRKAHRLRGVMARLRGHELDRRRRGADADAANALVCSRAAWPQWRLHAVQRLAAGGGGGARAPVL
eukprot:351076-Chlamydomonas_euryale.AAC.5